MTTTTKVVITCNNCGSAILENSECIIFNDDDVHYHKYCFTEVTGLEIIKLLNIDSVFLSDNVYSDGTSNSDRRLISLVSL